MIEAILSHGVTAFLARVALATPFLVSGALKLADLSAAAGEVSGLTGMQGGAAMALALLVVAVQLVGSVLLILGGRSGWIGAGLLAGFTLAATLVAHAFWTMEGPARTQNMMVFWEHAAICGGLLLAAHVSAGSRRRP